MAFILIHEVEILHTILKAFSQKTQLTFRIDSSYLCIHSLSPPYIYASLPSDYYTTCFSEEKVLEFTLYTKDLLTSLSKIDTKTLYIDDYLVLFRSENDFYADMRCLEEIWNDEGNGTRFIERATEIINAFYIKIPLSMPIHSHYRYFSDFSTKLLFPTSMLKCIPRISSYTNSMPTKINSNSYKQDDKEYLVITHNSADYEERVVVEVEYFCKGYLDFTCDNSWVKHLEGVEGLDESLIIGFSEQTMVVKCGFEKHNHVYLEVQVSEKIF